MTLKVIVFDFDGTLIDSNRLKYDAYFKLFGDSEGVDQTIRAVLAEMYENSRFEILEEIIKRGGDRKESEVKRKVDELANRYNDIVLAGAKACAEIPGAELTLISLAQKYRLYVSSTTPEVSLKEIVDFRGWRGYFVDVFGYPRQKGTTLKQIIDQENATGRQVLVVGDGESDRNSALENDCLFLHVGETFDFNRFDKDLENIRLQSIS